MKPILRSKNKITAFPIPAILLTLCILLGSFIWSLQYVGNNRITYPDLKLDPDLPMPVCSDSGGFHTAPFSLKLNSPSSGAIYYTTDGSQPTLSSLRYEASISITDRSNQENDLSAIPTSPRWSPPMGNVFKGTVLRAIVVTEENRKSRELVKTFFVSQEGAARYTLPVIALTVNRDDLFGYENGIYIMGKNYLDKRDYLFKNVPLNSPWWEYPSNYLKRGDNAGRPVNIEFYEPSGKLAFENTAEVRINGNATRGFGQKSLRISFKEKYGPAAIDYKLFPGYGQTHFSSFILRNSGNDWNKTLFRDALIQSIMRNSTVDLQAYRPAVVFINGEYWGIHTIRERQDENYLSTKYNVKTEDITILERMGTLLYGKKQDEESFKKLLDFIKEHSLALPENYEYVKQQLDMESFMDAVIANVYFCNSDWPNNNVKFWRCKPDGNSADSGNYAKDGRWHWILYDTDWGFGYTGKEDYRLNLLPKAMHTGSIGVIFNGLIKNKAFFNTFINRFIFHMNHTFNTKVVIPAIDSFKVSLAPEMNEHINRWRVIGSYTAWEEYVADLKTFALKRPEIQTQQLNEFIFIYSKKH